MKAIFTIVVAISLRLLCTPDVAQSQILWEHPNGISGGQIFSIGTGQNDEVHVLTMDLSGYHSNDGGKTWNESRFPGGWLQSSWIAVANTGTAFATFRDRVLRSADGGDTWEQVLTAETGLVMTIQGGDGKLYAVTGINCMPSQVFISTDDGITWKETASPRVPYNGGVWGIDVMKDGTMFVHAPMVGSMMRSTNGGASWEDIGWQLFWPGQYYIYAVRELNDGSIIAVSSHGGMVRTTDRGTSWSLVPIDEYKPGSNIVYDATPEGTVILSYDDMVDPNVKRVYRIKNGICEEIKSIVSLGWQIAIRYDGKGAFYFGTLNALYKTTDDGDTWTDMMIPNMDVPTIIRSNAGSIIGASSYVAINPRPYRQGWGSVARSTDNGTTWTRVLSPLSANQLVRGPGDRVLLASGTKLFLSTDDGITWEPRTTYVGNADQEYYPVYTMAFGKDDKLFVTLGNTGVFTSTDLGLSWEAAKSDEGFAAYALAIDSSGAVFTSGYPGDSTSGARVSQFYRSTDNGASWTKLPSIIQDSGARSLAARGEKEIFAAIDKVGVLRSEDKGENWTLIDKGLPKIAYSSLHVNDVGRVILATTDGVYLLDDAKAEWIDISSNMVVRDVESLATTSDGRLIAGSIPGVQRMADAIPAAPKSSSDTQVIDDLVRIALSNDVIGGGFDVQLQFKEELVGKLQLHDILGRLMLETPTRVFGIGREHLRLGQGLANGTYYVSFVSSQAVTHACIGNLW
jgi:photosystem II stability/assembly factor-like uncharacterized protein